MISALRAAGLRDVFLGAESGCDKTLGRLRKHPLMRAMRVDKTCLMVLERTLHLFRDPELLRRQHPLYRMICAPVDALRGRAKALVEA